MKKQIFTFIALMAIAVGGTACTRADGQISREAMGSVLGGAAGAWAGSTIGSGGGNVVATATGTFLGAMIGSELGRGIDQSDMQHARRAQGRAYSAPIGQTIQWQNPETNNHGAVTPTRQGTSSSGDYCREFQQTISVGGRQEQGYGVACRQDDGSWRIVSQN